MKYKKSFIFICLIICLFSIASISAGDVNDTAIANENQDSVDANVATAEVDNEKIENDVISSSSEDILGEKDNGTFTVLQNKINNVGDASTITLENDYAYTVSDDDALKKGIVVDGDQLIGDKTFTINGNGHIINGNKTARMFTLINDARLVLKNLTLTQGQGSDENIRGMIENVGGAIYSKHAKLTVINCTLTYNSADAWGGAIYAIDSSIHITDSQIAWNNAHCGAIYGDHCHINITDSQLTNNTAKSGGAIFGDYCHINITDSQLTNNTAGYGGAIFVSDCCVDITGSNIMLNTATEGGAIEAFGSLDYSYWVRITSSDITQNGATTGGAIYALNYLIRIFDSNLRQNGATTGGAIYATSYCQVSITGSMIVKNAATADGGAIYACNEEYGSTINEHPAFCNVNITDSTFIQNSATTGEAIYVCNKNCNVALTKNNFTSNGMYISNDSNVNIHNCILNNSQVEGSDIDLSDCEVIKAIVIDAVDLNKYYGGPEKFTVRLTKDNMTLSNVYIQVIANGKNYTAKTDSNGRVSVLLDLPVGSYDVVSSYDGVSTTSKVTVKSTLTTNDTSGTYSNSKCTATFLDTAGKALTSKKVTFKVVDKSYSATTNSSGVASANIPLGVGTYTVVAVNPVNNEQKTFKLTISKADSKIALTSTQSNGVATLTATLTPTTASGNVVFNVNGENRNVQINNGKATLTLKDLEPGNYTVTASYNGDKNLNASTSNTVTFNVAEVYPILTAKDLTKTYGTSNKFVVNLVDSKGNAIANAVVNVDIKGKITPITTGSNGQATMPINLAPATYTATVTYGNDAQATAKITVKKATPKLTAKAKTFKKSVKTKKYAITLKTNQNKVMKNTKVTIKIKKKTYTAKTNKKGVATFKLKKLTKKGKYTATITYKGNAYYNKLTKKVKITVK